MLWALAGRPRLTRETLDLTGVCPGMLTVTGVVVSGIGAWAPRIKQFPEVFMAGVGERLYPGTLNVKLAEALPVIAELRIPGAAIQEPEQDMLFERCRINGVPGFRLRPFQPATGAGGHGDAILEIVSATHLRPIVGADGSPVTLEFPNRPNPGDEV